MMSILGSSPGRKAGANGKKGARTSAGAMNLLANAAEDNEAYENTLTHAQLQQLQQHLLQQQYQVSMVHGLRFARRPLHVREYMACTLDLC